MLDCPDNKITSITVAPKGKSSLVEINYSGNPLQDLGFVDECDNLEVFVS